MECVIWTCLISLTQRLQTKPSLISWQLEFSIRGCDYLSTSLHVSFLVFTQAVRVFESWYGNVALQTKALVLDMQNVNKMAIMATVTQTWSKREGTMNYEEEVKDRQACSLFLHWLSMLCGWNKVSSPFCPADQNRPSWGLKNKSQCWKTHPTVI